MPRHIQSALSCKSAASFFSVAKESYNLIKNSPLQQRERLQIFSDTNHTDNTSFIHQTHRFTYPLLQGKKIFPSRIIQQNHLYIFYFSDLEHTTIFLIPKMFKYITLLMNELMCSFLISTSRNKGKSLYILIHEQLHKVLFDYMMKNGGSEIYQHIN